MSWIPVSRSAHAEHRYLPRAGFRHAAARRAVPVLLAELPRLLPHYMLGFAEQEGELVPVAVLGLAEHDNLYLHPDGRWLGAYVPSALRGFPFALVRSEHGERTLAVESAHLVEGDAGEPLFGDAGALAEPVAGALGFLHQCADNRPVTRQATQALQSAGLLTPWTPAVTLEGRQHTLGGLHRVDEQALNRLAAADYARLQGAPMTLAYAQLFASRNTAQLVQRLRFQQQHAAAASPPADLGALFGEDDDELMFDFER